MTSLALRLRDIERKLDPMAPPKRGSNDAYKALLQVKAMLEKNTSAQWFLDLCETTVQLMYTPQSNGRLVVGGQTFIRLEAYNNAWPVSVKLFTPVLEKKPTLEVMHTSETWEEANVLVHNIKELHQLLGNFLDSPAMLDWLKGQR